MATMSGLQNRTARLELREFKLDDGVHMHALESIPEVVRYQTWPPRSREEATRAVQEIVDSRHESPRKVIELAVIHCENKCFIGRVGGCIDHETHMASVWFSFMPSSQGYGYASEAMHAFIPLLHETFGVRRCEIECDPRNLGSRKLAQRLGFTKVSEVENAFECKGKWVGSLVFVKDLNPDTKLSST